MKTFITTLKTDYPDRKLRETGVRGAGHLFSPVISLLKIKGFFISHSLQILIPAMAVCIPLLTRLLVWNISPERNTATNKDPQEIVRAQLLTGQTIRQLDRKLASKIPKSYYLVINSTLNEFRLYRGNSLVRKDKCSTGSYVLLKNGPQQQWMFKTPKGEFRILGKTTSPVWKKPDWAFIEDGLPVPSANDGSRYEYGVLGDYALSLGNGYLIHGTLYQRFLGLPVTHGCIRLNDENLELVYHSLQIGSKVYIY